jgi:tRNA A37 threonylcarbamoyladenosine synthetase subunit TsaC/SUA5/YrdC
MSRYDIPGDAKHIYDTVTAGGAVIMPSDIGYGAVASDSEALLRLFRAKRRAPHKRHAMAGNCDLHRLRRCIPTPTTSWSRRRRA